MRTIKDSTRITTYIEPSLGVALDRLCVERDLAKARVIAEAIREYVLAREEDPALSLLARGPRHEGRPSLVEIARQQKGEAQMRKRVGRPLRRHALVKEASTCS